VIDVQFDTSAVDRMLATLTERAGQSHVVAAEVARQTRVVGVPVDTGTLAASFRVRETADGAEIVSDVPYARFVFGGTAYMAARPPRLEGPDLAATVAKELFA
jgi:hypothetical protein